MKKTLAIWVVVFAFAVCASVAYADSLIATIQFPFKAEGKEFAAGKYRFDADLERGMIMLRNESTGKSVLLPFTSRLSERGDDSMVVFDQLGDQYFLSEVYMPGIDGFELKALTGKHTHVKVKAGK